MRQTIFVLLFAAIKIVHVSSQSCDYVSELIVNYRESENVTANWSKTELTGCISDTSFKHKMVKEISIIGDDKTILILEKHFIANMEHLINIYIDNCHVESIEPGAFSNLPRLKKIDIFDNNFKNISEGVFNVIPSLQFLYLYRNNISYIQDHAFSNLPHLKLFGIEQNDLDHIKREWFTNTSNIQDFSIFHNKIRTIPTGMFHGWKKLKKLYLHSNEISIIEDELFKDNSPVMNYVNLHHNRLEFISPNAFPDSIFIENLLISGNLLNYLPEEFLKKIRVANINIFGNPFKCPCLEKIQKILSKKNVVVNGATYIPVKACEDKDVPVCGLSLNSSDTCIESVDKELTRQIISQMKELGYDMVFDKSGQQCAVFDDIN